MKELMIWKSRHAAGKDLEYRVVSSRASARRPTFSSGIPCGKKWVGWRFPKMQTLCLLVEPQLLKNFLAMLDEEASLHGADRH